MLTSLAYTADCLSMLNALDVVDAEVAMRLREIKKVRHCVLTALSLLRCDETLFMALRCDEITKSLLRRNLRFCFVHSCRF